MPYIGLDVGTSGCKASIVDREGRILSYKHCEYSPVSPQPGYIEIDAGTVWAAVKNVLSGVARDDITALSVASFGEAVILLGENDEVLSNSIYYCDIRGSEEVSDILSSIDRKRAEAVSGSRANPMFSANKLLWIKKHRPDLYKKAKKIFLFGDYIGYMLTGERKIDFSLASRTMLFDIRQGCWSQELGDAFGIDISRFSEPVRTGSVIGAINKSIANELGLPGSLTVVAGGHDQILAALGSGAVYRGDSVDGMGSSECITLVLNGEDWTPKMAEYNFCCEPYIFPNTYVTLAFNASSGTASRWYRDCFETERRDRLHTNLYGLLDGECPKAPTDLLFLPHVAGSGTPYLDSSMGGAILGLKTTTTKAEIYKAVLEGICFEMQWNAELLTECGLSLGGITAVGGSARSQTLMQIKADIMNRPVDTLASTETGTVGLALLCAYALGDITDLAAAAKRAAKKGRTFLPDPINAEIYSQKLRRYKRIYPALKTIYEK